MVSLTRCHQRALAVAKGTNQAQAWKVGLQAARLLQAYFPAEYAEAAARRPATLQRLYGALKLFLYLIEQHYFPLNSGYNGLVSEAWKRRAETPDVDPLLAHGQSVESCVGTLSYNTEQYLVKARPLYIGLGRNLAAIWDHNDTRTQNSRFLARALWLLVRDTGWSVGVSEAKIYEGVGRDRRRHLDAMPRLPADTNMDLLEHFLWRTPEINLVLRYACGQTPSPYANTSMNEAYGLVGGSSFSFLDRATVEYIKQEYAPGPAYRDAFYEQAKQLHGRPALVVELGDTIMRAAEELGRSALVRGMS